MTIVFTVVVFVIVSQKSTLAVPPMVAAGTSHTVGLKSDHNIYTCYVSFLKIYRLMFSAFTKFLVSLYNLSLLSH